MILPVKFYTIECVVKDFNIYFSILLEKSERDVKCLALILQLVAVLKTNRKNPKPTPLVGLGGEGVKAKGFVSNYSRCEEKRQ